MSESETPVTPEPSEQAESVEPTAQADPTEPPAQSEQPEPEQTDQPDPAQQDQGQQDDPAQQDEGQDEKQEGEQEKASAPTPRPVPRPTARPGVPSPAALAGKKPSAPLLPAVPPPAEYDEAAIAEARAFGSVAEDGTVTVQDGTQVRQIGTTTETDHEKALDPFARAYLDLAAFLDLTEKKLAAPEHTQNDLNRLLENLRKNMKEPQVVGDIPALRARAHDLRENAKSKIQALEAERMAARDEATARRTAFVESIEQLVATEPSQLSWKSAGETMRQMVPTWKTMQSEDVSLDRPTEEALWKRLSTARASFDRMRKQFFSQLDEKHGEAAQVKEKLIAEAESMKDSTDWGPTVRAYKDLMDRWRSAPRGSRKKDDAQWARFKAAQDHFFAARNEDLKATEGEQKENLKVKEALLAEAQSIDPAKDLDGAKEKLRSIQDRWEEAGKVPRSEMHRIEDRLRAVERAVRKAEEDEWRRTDPRTKARVEGASSQLHAAISSYQDALDKARAGGDPKKIAEAESALEARKEWLAVIERSARDLG
ncbi:MAG: DUF349 domain-containing protein [Brachybacterium faecium]|nr:MAG: DUF349 domain-containing protein [Brachybacterium faecium]